MKHLDKLTMKTVSQFACNKQHITAATLSYSSIT